MCPAFPPSVQRSPTNKARSQEPRLKMELFPRISSVTCPECPPAARHRSALPKSCASDAAGSRAALAAEAHRAASMNSSSCRQWRPAGKHFFRDAKQHCWPSPRRHLLHGHVAIGGVGRAELLDAAVRRVDDRQRRARRVRRAAETVKCSLFLRFASFAC